MQCSSLFIVALTSLWWCQLAGHANLSAALIGLRVVRTHHALLVQVWGDLAFEPDRLFAWRLFGARAQAFRDFLGPAGLGTMPDHITHTCCSQFAVQKTRVMQRGLAFFEGLQAYLQNNTLTGLDAVHNKAYVAGASAWPVMSCSRASLTCFFCPAGDVMTAFWAMIFGEGPQYELPPDCKIFFC